MVEDETSAGTLLGGRLAYRQLRAGHRSGFEPVLMAAFCPARPGARVLELGTGAGAAMLCLRARLGGITGIGVERHPALAGLAQANFTGNGFHDLAGLQADATRLPFASQTFQHVMANPPWFAPDGTHSPDSTRALAHHATAELLAGWIGEALRLLRDQGSLTLALPAASFAQAASLLRPACGGITLLPLWPRAGEAAKLILLRARKASRGPDVILPGLALHDEAGITAAAQAVLRDGAALDAP